MISGIYKREMQFEAFSRGELSFTPSMMPSLSINPMLHPFPSSITDGVLQNYTTPSVFSGLQYLPEPNEFYIPYLVIRKTPTNQLHLSFGFPTLIFDSAMSMAFFELFAKSIIQKTSSLTS